MRSSARSVQWVARQAADSPASRSGLGGPYTAVCLMLAQDWTLLCINKGRISILLWIRILTWQYEKTLKKILAESKSHVSGVYSLVTRWPRVLLVMSVARGERKMVVLPGIKSTLDNQVKCSPWRWRNTKVKFFKQFNTHVFQLVHCRWWLSG